MKKTFLLLLAATLLTGFAETSAASVNTISASIPDTGYDYGYAAGQRYLRQGPSPQQLKCEWHHALDNIDFYNSIGDTGHADWWQGYADGLQYFDNNQYEVGECGC